MFGADVIGAIKAHAKAAHPYESCGVVTEGGYLPLKNISPRPDLGFNCDEQMRPFLVEDAALALVHSHVNGNDRPSFLDVKQQIAMAIPWGIVLTNGDQVMEPWFWGDSITPPPLLGRGFRFGPSGTDGRGDCGALLRDWYWLERGIRLIEHPRPDDYNASRDAPVAPDYYRNVLISAGFVEVGGDPRVGDVALMRCGSRVPNHVAILVESGTILHHYVDTLSRREPLVRWAKFVIGWFRHG